MYKSQLKLTLMIGFVVQGHTYMVQTVVPQPKNEFKKHLSN